MKETENLTVSATSGATATYSLDEAFQFATDLHQKGRVQEAVVIYQSILNVREDHHQALHFLGLAKYQQGEKKDAVELIEKSLESAPDYTDAHNNLGNIFRTEGNLEKAKFHYNAVLSQDEKHHQALSNIGGIYKLEDKHETALECYQKALTYSDNNADYHLNSGIVQAALGRWTDAKQSFQKTIDLDPNSASGYQQLGQTLDALGQHEEALAASERAVELDSSSAQAHCVKGDALVAKGRLEDAVLAYRKAISCNAEYARVYGLLSSALCKLDRMDEGREMAEKWLELDENNPMAQHRIASLGMSDIPKRASNDYVERLFDYASPKFDKDLGGLGYKTPEILVNALKDKNVLSASTKLRILDSGCGTGLCGPLLEPYKNHMIGVDLSKGMLDRCREKECYDELVHSELTDYMEQADDQFDLIISADTLIYFGSLKEPLEAAHALQKNGDWLAFSLERHPEDGITADYQLSSSGRYSHSIDYVKTLCETVGYRIELLEKVSPRMEGGKPVAGAIFLGVRE